MTHLLEVQSKAIEKLRRYKVGALFMDPGTGKTRSALELVRSVPGVDYILWLTPFQTKDNLREELDRWGGDSIDIHGIESLSSSDRLYIELWNKLKNAQRPFMVVDESLKIKNWDAIRTRRIVELGKMCEYKLILNGTPLSRNLLDIWAQMEFLSPRILRMGLAEFKDAFCEYVTITKHDGRRSFQKEIIKGYHNIDYLYSLIGPFVYEAELDVDVKMEHKDICYSLQDDELSEHERLKEKYLDNEYMELRNNNIFLEITSKLQHNYSCSPEKFERFGQILSKHGADKVLVYARFVDTQNELRKRFKNAKVMSWQKHVFGLNLQSFNVIVCFDKVWDYALRVQAKHRVLREGQLDDCMMYELTGNVGLEDMMNRNAEKKGMLLQYFKQKSVNELRRIL